MASEGLDVRFLCPAQLVASPMWCTSQQLCLCSGKYLWQTPLLEEDEKYLAGIPYSLFLRPVQSYSHLSIFFWFMMSHLKIDTRIPAQHFWGPFLATENVINYLNRATWWTRFRNRSWQSQISSPALSTSILHMPGEDLGDQLFSCCTATDSQPISTALPWTQSLSSRDVGRDCSQPGRGCKSPVRLMKNHQGSEPLYPQQGSNCKISWGEILAPMETRGNSLWFTWGLACCPQPWALLDCKTYIIFPWWGRKSSQLLR